MAPRRPMTLARVVKEVEMAHHSLVCGLSVEDSVFRYSDVLYLPEAL